MTFILIYKIAKCFYNIALLIVQAGNVFQVFLHFSVIDHLTVPFLFKRNFSLS